VPLTCGRRTCPHCAHRRYLRLKDEYSHLNRKIRRGRILTLTLKNGLNVAELVDKAISSFKKLRRREIFRNVRGGFYAVEVVPKDAGLWNVHLHVIFDGPFLPQGKLSENWYDITGDSYVVDIQLLRKRNAGVKYVLGYCSDEDKVRDTWGGVPESRKKEFERAVKHRRLVQTFGHLHGVQKRDSVFECPECGGTNWINLSFEFAEGLSLAEWDKGRRPPPD